MIKSSVKSEQRVNYLGIDYGTADVGLALADHETRIAFAYRTIRNDEYLLQTIAEIIVREDVGTVVLGIPSHVNRREVEYDSERVGKKIQELIGVDIFYQDETFTTKIAQQKLIERGVKGIKRFDDQEAARIILQDWLDRKVLDAGSGSY